MSEQRLGPFLVEERLGAGGMGEVWAGRHIALEQRVAIKVIHGRLASTDRFQQAFLDEVRAVAGLRHPSVVEVLDYGTAEPGGPFPDGSPYLVMARATGSIREAPPGSWFGIRELLLQVLDALAHAHARGVVHLDIKPANLLRLGDRVALTDFGVAAFVGREIHRDAVRGSAAYMAPEQFSGRWREYGPATDLYALGTVAWELLCGEMPFEGADPTTLGNLKRTLPPPSLPADLAPADLGAWLQWMLATEPGDRFACAADAAAALGAISPSAEVRASGHQGRVAQDTLAFSTFSDESLDAQCRPVADPVAKAPAAPSVASWRGQAALPDLAGEALGIGLFGLRPAPFVGREPERDRLWALLERVRTERRPAVALIEGAQGLGSSELGRWLAHRADELGMARALVVEGEEQPGEFWERTLALPGLSSADAVVQLTRGGADLPEELAQAVAAMCQPGASTDLRDRVAIQVSLVEQVARSRPLALMLDALDLDGERFALALGLLKRAEAPVLVLVSVRSEDRVELDELASQVARLIEAGCETVVLEPLIEDDLRRCLEHHLRLAGPAVAQLLEIAAGNPQVALGTLGAWIDGGDLRPGPDGFEWIAGRERAPVSADWRGRVERVVAGSAEAEVALERAATYGVSVPRSVWGAVCADLDARVLVTLEESLARQGLIRSTSAGWTFAQPLLRTAVLQRAAEAGRQVGHHLHLASALLAVGPPWSYVHGDHLFAAERWEEAVPALLETVLERWNQGHIHRAQGAVARARAAAAQLGLAGEVWLRQARAMQALFASHGGRFDEAIALASSVVLDAEAAGDERALARALRARGTVHHLRGDLQDAVKDLARGAHLLERLGEVDLACTVQMTWMQALLQLGRYPEAEEVAASFAPERRRTKAMAHGALGILASYHNDFALAAKRFHESMILCRAHGLRVAQCGVAANLGDCYRHLGDLDQAAAFTEQGIAGARTVGLTSESVMRLNLVQIHLDRGDAEAAWLELEVARTKLERLGRRALLGAAHAVSLRCLALRGDWDRWDDHFTLAAELIEDTGVAEVEIAEAFERAADLAAAAGFDRWAREARAAAAEQRTQLGGFG